MKALAAFMVLRLGIQPGGQAMRYLIAALDVVAATACIDTPAQAQNYPWCEYMGGGFDGGGRNCGFISFEQCMQTASGNGGDCRKNTQYEPPGEHSGATPVARHPTKKTRKNS
jgi:Protein of unknown function (DUF3551)